MELAQAAKQDIEDLSGTSARHFRRPAQRLNLQLVAEVRDLGERLVEGFAHQR